MRHRDGRWLWFETAIRAVRDLDGKVTERQGAMRLIEERRRLQEIVKRQRDEATNLLAEQSALRKIATLVAAGAPPAACSARSQNSLPSCSRRHWAASSVSTPQPGSVTTLEVGAQRRRTSRA